MKIIVVEPMGSRENVFAKYMDLPLLGPLYIAAALRDCGFSVQVLNENILGRAVSMREIDADVICVSMITPTAIRGYEILREFKALRPEGFAVAGGFHPSFLPEEALRYADCVVVGEGEQVIAQVIKERQKGVVQGVPSRDLDELPFPDLSLLTGSERLKVHPLLTSRGCPFDCTFCAVTKMFGRRYKMHSVERVLEELGRVPASRFVFFYDDNFTANPNRTFLLLDAMMKKFPRLRWSAQVRCDIAKHEDLVSLMARAGCKRVYVGFESLSDEALESLNKRQKREDIVRAVETFHRYGIGIHGMFILGADGDAPEAARQTVDFCRKHKMDSVQFMALTPLPGTPLFASLEREGRILHKRWELYDGAHVVFSPSTQSPAELQEQLVIAFEDFYSLSAAISDGLNAIVSATVGLGRRLSRRFASLAIRNAMLKFQARAIIKQWVENNRDYLCWLREGVTARLGTASAQ